jgi:hypothetical protein
MRRRCSGGAAAMWRCGGEAAVMLCGGAIVLRPCAGAAGMQRPRLLQTHGMIRSVPSLLHHEHAQLDVFTKHTMYHYNVVLIF